MINPHTINPGPKTEPRRLELNRVARYVSGGSVEISSEAPPMCPEGGLLVDTLACGLCSGELMAWYMERKAPHILGHEVSGRVIESQNQNFPVGSLVFPHHHAPCMDCEMCRRGRFVHCETWRKTKLTPGGMADRFAVAAANLADTLEVNDLRPVDSALIEPLACVMKSLGQALADEPQNVAVVGLGSMGLMHLLMLPDGARGYDLNPGRVAWARSLGLEAHMPENSRRADCVIVCPGSQAAFDAALQIVGPGGTVVLFAPMPPEQDLRVPQSAYFNDITIRHSYSCGPNDTRNAATAIRAGRLRAEQVVTSFIAIEELPAAYEAMKLGETLKPMVLFD